MELAGAVAALDAVFVLARETDFEPPKPTLLTPSELRVMGFFFPREERGFWAGCTVPEPGGPEGTKEGTELTSFPAQEGVNSFAFATMC